MLCFCASDQQVKNCPQRVTLLVCLLCYLRTFPPPNEYFNTNISPYLSSRLTINRHRVIVREEIHSQCPFIIATQLLQLFVLGARSSVVSSASSGASQMAYFVWYNYCLFRLMAYLIEITTSLRYEDRVRLHAFLLEKCHSSCSNIWWWAFT
jgi:hypothetical protein